MLKKTFLSNILMKIRKKNVVKKAKNLPVQIFSLNTKFQATYITKLKFSTLYEVKEKNLK